VAPADEKSWGFVLKMIKTDVEEFMPEGLLDELAVLPPEEKRTRDTGRGRRPSQRGGGSRSRDGQRRERAEKEPETQVQPEQASEPRSPSRRSRGPRREKSSDGDRGALVSAEPRESQQPGKSKGFGDNVPAFLKK
jgi:hypothetical protein